MWKPPLQFQPNCTNPPEMCWCSTDVVWAGGGVVGGDQRVQTDCKVALHSRLWAQEALQQAVATLFTTGVGSAVMNWPRQVHMRKSSQDWRRSPPRSGALSSDFVRCHGSDIKDRWRRRGGDGREERPDCFSATESCDRKLQLKVRTEEFLKAPATASEFAALVSLCTALGVSSVQLKQSSDWWTLIDCFQFFSIKALLSSFCCRWALDLLLFYTDSYCDAQEARRSWLFV